MTTDRTRGYGHCGEWNPISLPDTAAHVARVHDIGLEYMLWYAIPFVGWDSPVWDKFKDYGLRNLEHMQAIVVDPRYPMVREYLAERLSRAVSEWGMDGLKVDFVDWFATPDAPEAGPEADCAEVSEGVQLPAQRGPRAHHRREPRGHGRAPPAVRQPRTVAVHQHDPCHRLPAEPAREPPAHRRPAHDPGSRWPSTPTCSCGTPRKPRNRLPST